MENRLVDQCGGYGPGIGELPAADHHLTLAGKGLWIAGLGVLRGCVTDERGYGERQVMIDPGW